MFRRKIPRVSRHQQLFAGPRHGNVQLAVDDTAIVVLEAGGGEELQLVVVADGEVVDDDVALRALVALNGVYRDVAELRNPQSLYLLAYAPYLDAVGHDNAYGLLRIKTFAVETVDAAQQVRNKHCQGVEEHHALLLQQVVKGILRRLVVVRVVSACLVGQGHSVICSCW